MTSFVYANSGQLPPPPVYLPSFGAIDALNLNAIRSAQGKNPIENPVAMPAKGVITDIAEIPTLEEVTLRNFHEFDDKLKVYNLLRRLSSCPAHQRRSDRCGRSRGRQATCGNRAGWVASGRYPDGATENLPGTAG